MFIFLCLAMASRGGASSGLWLISPTVLDEWEADCCWSNWHSATLRILCVFLLWPRTGTSVSWNICFTEACARIAIPNLFTFFECGKETMLRPWTKVPCVVRKTAPKISFPAYSVFNSRLPWSKSTSPKLFFTNKGCYLFMITSVYVNSMIKTVE